VREPTLTLQEALDVAELAGVVELAEVFGLLREVFALRERVSLVCDEVRGYRVQLRDERGEVDVWRMVSRVASWASPVFLLLHAPMAFWNLLSSSWSWAPAPASGPSAGGGVSALSSMSTPPSMACAAVADWKQERRAVGSGCRGGALGIVDGRWLRMHTACRAGAEGAALGGPNWWAAAAAWTARQAPRAQSTTTHHARLLQLAGLAGHGACDG
jgi:hypothetical protein